MSLRIGVLIPAHDVAAYIGEALDSVMAQSRPADEIVVVDDGSRDGTAVAVRSWADSHVSPIRLLQQAHAGAAAARNFGLQHLTADIVALLDADDAFLPEHLGRAESAFRRHPDLVLYFADVEIFTKEGSVSRGFLESAPLPALPKHQDSSGFALLAGSVYCSLLRGNYMPVSSTVLARWAVEEVGGYDPRFINAADRDLNLRLSRVGPFACSTSVTARKRLREDSLSDPRHARQAWRYRLAVLRKMLEQSERLRLDTAERLATRKAMHEHAFELLYASSSVGIPDYLDACRFVLSNSLWGPALNPKHLLRACARSAGWPGRGSMK